MAQRSVVGLLRQAGLTAAAARHLPASLRAQGCQLHEVGPVRRPFAPQAHAPVVLVHGLAATIDCWTHLSARLATAGFDRVFAFSYNGLASGLPELGGALVGSVERVMERTGSDTVHLVGHSLGGLVVRMAVEAGGLWTLATTVVTVATPHRGSPLAWAAPGPAARVLRSGRPVLPDPVLVPDRPAPRYVNFYCSRDAVLPRRSARLDLDWVTNVEIEGAGHVGATQADPLLSDLPRALAAAELARLAARPVREQLLSA
jgi:triacylglycerol lipase